jgi:hypothetical protein
MLEVAEQVSGTSSRLYKVVSNKSEARRAELARTADTQAQRPPSQVARADENQHWQTRGVEGVTSNASDLLAVLVQRMSDTSGKSVMQTRLALKRLYNHLASHPDVDIELHLGKVSLRLTPPTSIPTYDVMQLDSDLQESIRQKLWEVKTSEPLATGGLVLCVGIMWWNSSAVSV